MLLTEEKHNLIHNLEFDQIENFNEYISRLDCDDYEDFIEMFLDDLQNLFYGCSETQFEEVLRSYDQETNNFE